MSDIVLHDGGTFRHLDDYQRFARVAIASGSVHLQGGGDRALAEAVIRIAAGAELGIGPMASLGGVVVIKGKTTLSANLMAALVRRNPRYRYTAKWGEDKEQGVFCAVQWFVDGDEVGITTFSERDAKRAGLTNNPTWKKYPKDMTFARAFSSGARKFCGDVTLGAYTPDELGAAPHADDVTVEVVEDEPVPVEHTVPVAGVVENLTAKVTGKPTEGPVDDEMWWEDLTQFARDIDMGVPAAEVLSALKLYMAKNAKGTERKDQAICLGLALKSVSEGRPAWERQNDAGRKLLASLCARIPELESMVAAVEEEAA